MRKSDKEEIIQLYENRLKECGECIQTVGWKDKEQQELRFKILSEIGNLQNTKILDVGCGFGDFYNYLVKKKIKVDYTGFDIAPNILKVAKKNHPNLNFEVKDILTENVDDNFDYVFASGILNKRISDNIRYTQKIIKKMFDLCNIGVGINMTTDYVDYKEEYLYYHSPEEIFEYCKSLTKYLSLRHDYPLYEFTIYLFKE